MKRTGESVFRFWNRNRQPIKAVLCVGLLAFILLIFQMSGGKKRRGHPKSVIEIHPEVMFGFARSLELAQNDSKLLEFVRYHHVHPPSVELYDLEDPKGDPVEGHGKEWQIVLRLGEKDKTKGFFIEAGANDGEYMSYTLVLERDYKWTGVLVEPDPILLKALFGKRRKAWVVDTCLSEDIYPGQVPMQHLKERSELNQKIGSKNPKAASFSSIPVKCLPLFTILSAVQVFKVDYFRLSVENFELDVLKTIPFDHVFIKIISVEIHPSYRTEIIEFLKVKSYVCFQRAELYETRDFLFIHTSISTDVIEKDKAVLKCKKF